MDKKIQDFFKVFFDKIGENGEREGLLKTPNRVLDSWENLYSGYAKNPLELLNATKYSENYDEMVILKEIEF